MSPSTTRYFTSPIHTHNPSPFTPSYHSFFLYFILLFKVQNVLKYSRNGCLVDDNVLIMSEAYEKLNEVEFRSLAIGKHKDHDALFIADAAGDESRLLIFGGCIKEQDDYFMRNKRYVTCYIHYSVISILSSFAMIQIDDDTTDISFKSWLLGQIIQGWITGE